jgi:hypothetical protein
MRFFSLLVLKVKLLSYLLGLGFFAFGLYELDQTRVPGVNFGQTNILIGAKIISDMQKAGVNKYAS